MPGAAKTVWGGELLCEKRTTCEFMALSGHSHV